MKVFHEYHTEPWIRRNDRIDYAPHLHQELEIITLFSGNAVAIINGTEYPVTTGDTIIVFPNMVHSYRGGICPDVGKYIFHPDLLTDLKAVFGGKVPQQPVVRGGTGAARQIHHIAGAIAEEYPTASTPVRKAYLSLLTAKILECCELEEMVYANHNTLDLILNYCREHYCSDLSLATLSRELNISQSHLSHVFSSKIKMDFRTYLNTLRLNHAYDLLSGTDLSMTEIAEQCGFTCLRTFDRTFREQNGLSPSAYRKQYHRT